MRAPKDAPAEIAGDYYGLPWPCWGTPEFRHPGKHQLYNTNLAVKDGGGAFRPRFGVEYEEPQADGSKKKINMLAEGSFSKDSEIKDGYPQFTYGMLKKLGWDKDLTEAEKGVIEKIGELKREIIESRGLIIKTNNLTNALSADLKSIARRQQTSERSLAWTSATAYVVFVIVVFVALKLAWDARVDAVRAETETTRATADRVSKELKEAQKRDDERARAEQRGAAFYDLVRQNKRAEIVEQYEILRKEPLSKAETAFFADAAELARDELSIQSYYQGLDHARTGRWLEASQAFEESIRLKDSAAHIPSAKLRLAEAQRRLGSQPDAIPSLQQLSEAVYK